MDPYYFLLLDCDILHSCVCWVPVRNEDSEDYFDSGSRMGTSRILACTEGRLIRKRAFSSLSIMRILKCGDSVASVCCVIVSGYDYPSDLNAPVPQMMIAGGERQSR